MGNSILSGKPAEMLGGVRGKIMYFSFGQILNLFYWFRPSFCVLFVLLLDRLSGKE